MTINKLTRRLLGLDSKILKAYKTEDWIFPKEKARGVRLRAWSPISRFY
jgi:hypothetical protein